MDEKEQKAFLKYRDTWLKTKLRHLSIRWPESSQAVKASRVARGEHQCAMCGNLFKGNEIHKDHTDPVVPVTGPVKRPDGGIDWNVWIDRCFIHRDKYQILCIVCHKAKTAIEDAMRATHNDAKRTKEQLKIKKGKSK